MEPKITYIPLRNGYWGVRIVGADHTPTRHELITVTLRDGRKKEESISRVLYSDEKFNAAGKRVRVVIAEIKGAKKVQNATRTS